jgi:hypothetical protein
VRTDAVGVRAAAEESQRPQTIPPRPVPTLGARPTGRT